MRARRVANACGPAHGGTPADRREKTASLGATIGRAAARQRIAATVPSSVMTRRIARRMSECLAAGNARSTLYPPRAHRPESAGVMRGRGLQDCIAASPPSTSVCIRDRTRRRHATPASMVPFARIFIDESAGANAMAPRHTDVGIDFAPMTQRSIPATRSDNAS
jgi:hypothetical protein